MGSRKKIAVVTAEVFNQYANRILDGISRQCAALDYDACVLTMMFNIKIDSPIQSGEENIYNLIRSGAFAGVIMISGSMVNQALAVKIEQKLVEMNMPVISIDSESEICETVYAEDIGLFEMITDHFIECHNCREIMCFTGPEEKIQSQSRLLGYKRSLEKHGISYDEKLVVYGNFWKDTAKALAEEFASGARKLPQAIVCANDVMAITLCNCLVNSGYKIPGDVMVSGYDGSTEAINNIPSVTSLYPENVDLGARAVCKLHQLITGDKVPPISIKKGSILTAQSCGCGEDQERNVKAREDYAENIEKYEEFYRMSGMEEQLLCAKNLDELLRMVDNFTYIINGLERYMMCLCENWDNMEYDNDDKILTEGYTENMVAKMFYSSTQMFLDEVTFKSKDILPEAIYDDFKKPQMFFILPIHFNDRCFGYSVFTFRNIKQSRSPLYARWSKNINIALEFLRVRNKLMSMNQRIFLSSIRDTLTGIYNRKGFKRFSESIFKKAKSERKKLLILYADLDMLKYINDNFGHIEGDNAITVTANVLSSCCKNNEVCARIGGDEYAVIGCYDYSDDIVEGYVKYINDYFERYNFSSDKPYKVGASLGYFCGVPAEDSELQDYLNLADRKMYENKFERRKQR